MEQPMPKPGDASLDLARDRTSFATYRTQLALDRTTLTLIRTTLVITSRYRLDEILLTNSGARRHSGVCHGAANWITVGLPRS